jgi:hypothetical protein
MFKKNLFNSIISLFVIIGIAVGTSAVHIELAYAAALNTLSDTQSSVKVSALSDHTIQFVTPTGVPAGQAVAVNFPVGWTLGALGTTSIALATSTSATCSGFTDALVNTTAAASGLTWGVATTTTSVTITSNTAVIPANRCIQIRLGSNARAAGTTTISNPSSATSSVITISAANGTDTGTITANIITDDTVAVTGLVQQSISFVISTSTIYFGTLSSASSRYASSTNIAGDASQATAHDLLVGTNAPYGYAITVRGQTLTSQQNPLNTISAIGTTAASSTVGSEQFGIRATVSGGTGSTIGATYASTTAFGYDATATTSSLFASGSGSTNTSTYSLRYAANIAGTTEAGTYAANLVYVATANF